MTIPAGATPEQKLFAHGTRVITAGSSVVLDARGLGKLTVITPAGGTATVSRVDSATASSDSADTAANTSVALATRSVLTVDWPFYRITAAGGTVRVGLG